MSEEGPSFEEEKKSNEGDQELKRRLTKLLNKVAYRGPREADQSGTVRMSDPKENVLVRRANEIFTLVTEIRNSGQIFQWPSSEGVVIPRNVYLVKINEQTGQPILGGPSGALPEKFELPARPRPFIEALEAYVAGEDWDKVKEIMSRNTDIIDKQLEEELAKIVDAITDFKSAGNAASLISGADITNKKVSGQLINRLRQRLEKAISIDAKKLTTLPSVAALHDDAMAFFHRPDGQLMGGNAMLMVVDTIDGVAMEIAHQRLSEATTQEQVDTVIRDLESYPFTMPDFQRTPLLEEAKLLRPMVHLRPKYKLIEASPDLKDKLDFMLAMQRKRSEQGLDELEKDIAQHQFENEEMGKRYRGELLYWIDRKRNAYSELWAAEKVSK